MFPWTCGGLLLGLAARGPLNLSGSLTGALLDAFEWDALFEGNGFVPIASHLQE